MYQVLSLPIKGPVDEGGTAAADVLFGIHHYQWKSNMQRRGICSRKL